MDPIRWAVAAAAHLVVVLAGVAGPAVTSGWAAGASRCAAVAGGGARLIPVAAVEDGAPRAGSVTITFVTHATFRIESPGGVIIATDYAGFAGAGRPPDVATMNHAHVTHYTHTPDRRIAHILEGWGDGRQPARHSVTVGDVHIRNVSTDIRSAGGLREKDGNSIFIFEVAGLCIGHLGHLHHTLGADHLAEIGQLDVVMVPVDGSYTMAQASMVEVLEVLKARIVIPMHFFGPRTLAAFTTRLGQTFEVRHEAGSSTVVSAATLPAHPTVLVLEEQSPMVFE